MELPSEPTYITKADVERMRTEHPDHVFYVSPPVFVMDGSTTDAIYKVFVTSPDGVKTKTKWRIVAWK